MNRLMADVGGGSRYNLRMRERLRQLELVSRSSRKLRHGAFTPFSPPASLVRAMLLPLGKLAVRRSRPKYFSARPLVRQLKGLVMVMHQGCEGNGARAIQTRYLAPRSL